MPTKLTSFKNDNMGPALQTYTWGKVSLSVPAWVFDFSKEVNLLGMDKL